MPTFDFNCPKCGNSKTKNVPTANTKVRCKCGGWMTKHFSPPTVIFKGEGFYRNDSISKE